jgi:putative addiction module killer protein
VIDVRQTQEFADWLAALRDRLARQRIAARIERLRFGLLGDVKALGSGLSELRVDHGPGYRLYFIQRGQDLIVLLCGGDKGSQPRDIARARRMIEELDA